MALRVSCCRKYQHLAEIGAHCVHFAEHLVHIHVGVGECEFLFEIRFEQFGAGVECDLANRRTFKFALFFSCRILDSPKIRARV